mmetsp:Transcript_111527/g.197529  ORF Transcript_111527/g.197529 Transcript_111527/m.197529 type:complete len:250 (-) Transcript_111527:62-811(-)
MESSGASHKVVYFIRHGESEANACRHDGWRILNPKLTERGMAQAASWAAETPSWGVEKVFVSPLLRTLCTAGLAFQGSSAPLVVCRAAREHGWSEPQNRGTSLDVLKEQLHSLGFGKHSSRFHKMHKLASPHRFWDPDAEGSLERKELHRRRKDASAHFFNTLRRASERCIACVCHYHVIEEVCGRRVHNCQAVRCIYEQGGRATMTLMEAQVLDMPSMGAVLPSQFAESAEVIEAADSDGDTEDDFIA